MSNIEQAEARDTGIEPLVVRPRGARVMYGGLSEEALYGKIRRGEVDSYLDGRRRVITVESIKRDIARGLAAAAERGFERAPRARHPGQGRRA